MTIYQKTISLLAILFLSSCLYTSKVSNQAQFRASKNATWAALTHIFKKYPIKTIDKSTGYIETEELKGKRFWTGPHQKNFNKAGLKSVIKAQLVYNKPFSYVSIDKTIYKQNSIIDESVEIPSDLLEEQSLLYRLERELYIKKSSKALSK